MFSSGRFFVFVLKLQGATQKRMTPKNACNLSFQLFRHWLDRTYFVGLCCKSMFGKTELFAGKFKSGVSMKMEYYLRGWGEQTSEHIWDSVANRGPKKLSSCLNQGVIAGRAGGGDICPPNVWIHAVWSIRVWSTRVKMSPVLKIFGKIRVFSRSKYWTLFVQSQYSNTVNTGHNTFDTFFQLSNLDCKNATLW